MFGPKASNAEEHSASSGSMGCNASPPMTGKGSQEDSKEDEARVSFRPPRGSSAGVPRIAVRLEDESKSGVFCSVETCACCNTGHGVMPPSFLLWLMNFTKGSGYAT